MLHCPHLWATRPAFLMPEHTGDGKPAGGTYNIKQFGKIVHGQLIRSGELTCGFKDELKAKGKILLINWHLETRVK